MDRRKEIMDRFGDLLDENTIEELASYSNSGIKFTKISEIGPGRVNIKGRISGIGSPETANEIFVSDETGRIRVLLWDREIYYKAEIGMNIEIYNGFVKEGKKGLEVHANRFSIVRLFE